MRRALALVLMVAAVGGLQAQAPAPSPGDGAATAAPAAQTPETTVDTSKLGVSMSRIQRGLRMSEARERSSGTPFKLEYQIQVFGTAPRLDLLNDFDYQPDGTAVVRRSDAQRVPQPLDTAGLSVAAGELRCAGRLGSVPAGEAVR